MKRKSGQHRQDKRKQARADESSGPAIRDGVSFTQLELAPTQVPTLLLLLLLLLLRLLQQRQSAPALILMWTRNRVYYVTYLPAYLCLQSVTFTGSAVLEVTAGCLTVFG
jgi:hypothetical protein